ncbi:MAG: response regulator [Spirochaetes bacterium]|nr:response regulator [Spirochaetota bacterium]
MKKRIYIVDDDMIAGLYMQETLGDRYIIAGLAVSGEEAAAGTVLGRPDVILMDIRLMGEMSGIDAAKRIWESLNITVIYCAAYNDTDTVEETKEIRPAGIPARPVNTL